MFLSSIVVFSKETTVPNSGAVDIMFCLKKLQSQFVPFLNVSVEYSVELEKSGKWEFYSKHQLKQNVKNLFFKERSVCVPSSEESKELLLYREIAWNGVILRAFESSIWSKNSFEIKESYGKQRGSCYIMSGGASSFSTFLSFYDVENPFFGTIYDALNAVKTKDDIVFTLDGAVATVILKNAGLQLVLNIKTGALLKKIRGVYDEKEGMFEKQVEFEISRTAIVEGRQVPVEFICTRYRGEKIRGREKVIVNPETIKFNIPEKDFDLTIKFPVGSRVSNSIENTSYTVSELDGEGDLSSAKQTLDALIEKTGKIDK